MPRGARPARCTAPPTARPSHSLSLSLPHPQPPTAKRLLPADYAWVDAMYRNISAWGAAHLPGGAAGVYMGEAGCQLKAPSRADVLAWYALVATDANHTIGRLSVWDDDGTWGIYNRAARTWDQGVLKALGLA